MGRQWAGECVGVGDGDDGGDSGMCVCAFM